MSQVHSASTGTQGMPAEVTHFAGRCYSPWSGSWRRSVDRTTPACSAVVPALQYPARIAHPPLVERRG